MSNDRFSDGVVAERLDTADYENNFSDLHPVLSKHEALVAADRCYFCYDAPCMTACPTTIDIPMFIRQISTGNDLGSAKTILDQNIMGGMCARVCPTETLCEEVCVREVAEGKPVKIGQLQRYATDAQMRVESHPYVRADSTGKKIAVVGAGPTGLACAHRLAMHGHDVTVYEARAKAGGLNEFGIASYKSVDGFAQAEVDWLLSIGGINIEYGKKFGDGLELSALQSEFDAVYLGIGLGGVNSLRMDGEYFISKIDSGLYDIMYARIDQVANLGFEWIEFDNMDWAFDDENRAAFGFKVSAKQAITYFQNLCAYAHKLNTKCMAKNITTNTQSFDGVTFESYALEKNWWNVKAAKAFLKLGKTFIITHYNADNCQQIYAEYKAIYSPDISFICEDNNLKTYMHFNQ